MNIIEELIIIKANTGHYNVRDRKTEYDSTNRLIAFESLSIPNRQKDFANHIFMKVRSPVPVSGAINLFNYEFKDPKIRFFNTISDLHHFRGNPSWNDVL